jgi:hypothetical protein
VVPREPPDAIFAPDTNQSGQGVFLRGAGGVLVMDAGQLVFDPASGVIEAALCSKLD